MDIQFFQLIKRQKHSDCSGRKPANMLTCVSKKDTDSLTERCENVIRQLSEIQLYLCELVALLDYICS